MRDTVRLGRVAGVPVGLNWSLVVVAGLLAYVLANSRLPYDAPGYHPGAYAVVGVLTALGLLVTVLAHELGHALVARHQRLRVDGITLSWIGGITRIEGEPTTAGTEAVLAGMGPVISLAAGGVLWAVHLLLVPAGGGTLAAAAVGWLALINVVLGVFNLIPAAPLDGGRIFHAVTWAITGDRWRAARMASAAGMAFGVVVIVAGGWEASLARGGTDLLDAVVTGMLGWWLIAAARSERQLATMHRALDGARCADLMRPVMAGPGWVTVDAFLAGCPVGYHAPSPVWLLEGWGDDAGYAGVVATEALQLVPPPLRSSMRPLDVALPLERAAGAHPLDDLIETLTDNGGSSVILITDHGRTVGAIVPSDVDAVIQHGAPRVRFPAAPTDARVSS